MTNEEKFIRGIVIYKTEDMAHQLGISFATVNRWENGKTKPSKLALKAF